MPMFYQPQAHLECRRFDSLTFGEHFHDHLELVFLAQGASSVRVDTVSYALQSGDVLLTFPNQLHSYQDSDACQGILCILPHRPFEDLAPVFRQCVPACPVIPHSALPPQVPALFEALVCTPAQEPYSDTVRKGYLGVLLGTLLPLMTLRRVGESSSDTVQSVLRYCAENYQQELTLESVSHELHISKYHISHLFSQKIHIGFSDFINTLRVQDACGQLKQGVGITQACVQAGFSSIRSFNRVFLRQMGMTPRRYQQLNSLREKKTEET